MKDTKFWFECPYICDLHNLSHEFMGFPNKSIEQFDIKNAAMRLLAKYHRIYGTKIIH